MCGYYLSLCEILYCRYYCQFLMVAACLLFVLYRWAIIKDKDIYQRMLTYLTLNTLGVSKDSQLRALKLLKVVLATGGREIFEFGHETMRKRWEKLNKVISTSKRFSLQKITPKYCTYFQQIRGASPGNSPPNKRDVFEYRVFTLCFMYTSHLVNCFKYIIHCSLRVVEV